MEQATQEAEKVVLRMPDEIGSPEDKLDNDELTLFTLILRNQDLSFKDIETLASEEIYWETPGKFNDVYNSLVAKKVIKDLRPAVV